MYSEFESEISVRPDDIDMNNHVHNSKYFDYVLAARYEQMKRDYKMSMEEFHDLGYSWVVSASYIEYKRALKMGDQLLVRTALDNISGAQVKINFRILIKPTEKTAAEGYLLYAMISLNNGRPVRIPEEIIKKYSI